MNIEALIPTHHKTLDQVLEIVKQSKATGHVLVCNQTDENKRASIGDIEVACFNDIGVSKNRNHLLDNATGDICVCIDDDCSLVPDYINKVQRFFDEHSDAEFVLFNGIVTKENNRLVHNKKTKRVRSFSSIAYGGGPGLVFKRDAIYRYGLRYREDLGYPNEIIIGEDSAFLKSVVDSKAVVYRSSEILFSIDGDVDNSVYFNGVDDRFLVSKGYVIKLVHPKLTSLFILRVAWKMRHWRGNTKTFLELVRKLKSGARRCQPKRAWRQGRTLSDIELGKIKNAELVIMDEIHRICIKCGIQYSLFYGSMLGAVRHHGFIPWDDDIDIVMLRNDYEKFEKACANGEMSPRFFLQTKNTDPHFHDPFLKKVRLNKTVLKEGTVAGLPMHHGIWVDIFVLDYADDKLHYFQKETKEYILWKDKYRFTHDFPDSNIRGKIYLLLKKMCLPTTTGARKKCELFRQKAIKKSTTKEKLFVASGKDVNALFERNKLGSAELVRFEDRQYFCFSGSDYCLRILFGDYWKLPPESQRENKHKFVEVVFDD